MSMVLEMLINVAPVSIFQLSVSVNIISHIAATQQ